MGRDIAAGFKKYYGDNAVDNWTQLLKEFVGSMILILVASRSGLDAGFGWGITFVVLSIVFGKNHHFNSFVTFYRSFVDEMCVVQGVFYLGAQFLGAFVAGKLGGALFGADHAADTVKSFEITNWQAGLQTYIAVSIFLWTYNHVNGGKGLDGSMPHGIFMIASIAMCFMFQSDFVFSYHRCFASLAGVKASGGLALWGAVACIVTHVKAKLMKVETRWFFEAKNE